MAFETPAFLLGNLTRDPELRITDGGRQLANMGIACNRRYQVNGEWQEEVSFFNMVAWGDLATHAAASLTKGTQVLVQGRWTQRTYEKDGEKRSTVEVVVDNIGPALRFATAVVTKVQTGASRPPLPSDYDAPGGTPVTVPDDGATAAAEQPF